MGSGYVSAQTIIAFQGFEGTAADNWNYTPPSQNANTPATSVGAANYGAGYAATGNFSMRVGGGSTACGTGGGNCMANSTSGGTCTNANNGDDVEFAAVNISCFTNVSISAAYRSHIVCVGAGFDAADRLYFEIKLNGGNWFSTATVEGNNNCVWTYATTTVNCNGSTPVANPYVYNVPAGTQTVAFRIRIVRDRTDEVFYVDNVKLTGTGTPLAPISIQHINP